MAVSKKDVETPAAEILHQTKMFDSNLPTALYFKASKYFLSSIIISFWSQKFLRRRNRAATRSLWCCLSWPQVVTTLPCGFWCSVTYFTSFCCQQCLLLHFLASLRMVNHFHSLWWPDGWWILINVYVRKTLVEPIPWVIQKEKNVTWKERPFIQKKKNCVQMADRKQSDGFFKSVFVS
jgi:hypothetical protein